LRIPLRLFVLLLGFSASVFGQEAPAPQPEVLTLNQAIALAQENNRQLKISYQSVLAANDQILSARTQRYPQFNMDLTGSSFLTPVSVHFQKGVFGTVDGTVNGPPVPSTDVVVSSDPKLSGMFQLQAYQPLSQLYNIHLNLGSLDSSKKLTIEQLRQQSQQITNSVENAYYSLIQTQSAADAAEANVAALRELNRIKRAGRSKWK
jgi:outer membrane protein TolC